MENTYLTALHGMEGLFRQKDAQIQGFHKASYADSFKEFYVSNMEAFQALEDGYNSAIEKGVYISNMAEALVNTAKIELDGITKKREVENRKIDLSLVMVAYILPAFIKFRGNCSEPMIEASVEKWKECFPGSNISAGSFEDIEGGFHKKWCYITTAVCRSFGKGDDCYELSVLRDYRDHYLAFSENGEELIREYYDVAPTIVKRIEKRADSDDIYRGIWEQYIGPCISLIEEDKKEECCRLYSSMVHDLEEEYFYSH